MGEARHHDPNSCMPPTEIPRLKYLDNDSRIPGSSMCNVTNIGGMLSFGLASEPGVYQWHSGSGRRRPQGPET